MFGYFVIGALLWLAILLVAKDNDVHWFRPIWWLVLASIVSFGVEYVLVDAMGLGIFGAIVSFLVYFGVIFYFLWNNYGGMGLPKIITILVIFFLMQLGYELFFIVGVLR